METARPASPRSTRRAASASIAPVAAAIVVALAACTSAASPAPTAIPTGAISTPVVATPAPTVAPAASVSAAPSPTAAGTTPSDFGPIRDAVPGTFPLPPDLQPADLPEGPYSGTYSTATPPGAVAGAIAAGLEFTGWTAVTTSGPTEAGEVTIDATGATAGCRTRVTVGAQGGMTFVKVLYGASCPAE